MVKWGSKTRESLGQVWQTASNVYPEIDVAAIWEKNLYLLQTLGTVLVECRPTPPGRFHFLDIGAGLKGRSLRFTGKNLVEFPA
ncbi:hypothetical protein LMG28688_02264 [Paraburkholderia caffeinitolerans]|uniref:Uncharacterized protein n=1 Tax=Paraburkholderia caffeinitolerans TaxID=1723730 RepID=A0A6J5FVC6_9BURK|nr:hypothetical protein LMG28688_02264 [Paraburkholderia caffeinitolerans]